MVTDSASRYDILVAGAGPAGSHAARRVAERGWSVALLDENEAAREHVVCTGIVGTEAFDRFDLPEKPVRDEIADALFVSPSGVEVDYRPEEPMARVVDRTAFDGALALRAELAGADLLRGHAAREVSKDGDGVAVIAELSNGGERTLRARALVVATGHQRWLHEDAGLGTPRGYVHGVHADVPFSNLEAAELYFGNEVAPGFFAWAVPFGDGTARVGVLAEQGSRKLFERFVRRPEIRERIFPGGEPENGGSLRHRLRSRGIVQGPVEPSVADRVLAVGEAAGQVKTTTAGGIFYGMLGAEMAAEVLSEALEEGDLSAERLSAYEDRWRDELGSEIEAGLRLQRLGRELSDPEIDELFEALQNGVASTIRKVVQFDWHRPALEVLFKRSGAWKKVAGRSPVLPNAG